MIFVLQRRMHPDLFAGNGRRLCILSTYSLVSRIIFLILTREELSDGRYHLMYHRRIAAKKQKDMNEMVNMMNVVVQTIRVNLWKYEVYVVCVT